MSNDYIEEGDLVEIVIDADQRTIVRGTVISGPCAVGGAWAIRGEDGRLYYVQTYSWMVRK